MFPIDIARPYFLILLLSLPYVYLIYRRQYISASRRARRQLLIRCLMIVALILGLAELRVVHRLERLCLVFVLDISPSIPREEVARAVSWIEGKLRQRQPGDIAGLVVFDSQARVMAKPQGFKQNRFKNKQKKLIAKLQARTKEWVTDIGSGLELADQLFPAGYQSRIILISDGNQHAADILPRLVHSRGNNIMVDVLPVGGRQDEGDAWIDRVHIPSQVSLGQGFNLEVSLMGNLIGEGELKVFLDNKLVQQKRVWLTGKGVQLARCMLRINKPGNYPISVELSAPHDRQPENNYGACWASVYRQARLLYITDSPASPSPLLKRLKIQLPVDVSPPSALEASHLRYLQYTTIVLENISAFSLSYPQMKMLEEWVHQLGGGLVVIGGDKSFGAGGYLDTPLERVLPVEMQVDNLDRRSSLGVVLVLDKSESMGGVVGARTKLNIAIEAAIASLNWLKPQDLIGVVAFDTRAQGVVRLTSGAKKSPIIEKIKTIKARGKTNIYPGLELAYKWLRSAAVDIKHVLLLSDGKSVRGNFDLLVDKIAAQGITVSAVGIGPDCDRQLLSLISQHGGGRLFLTNDYYQLQRIFFKDMQIATKSLLRQATSQPQPGDKHEILAGIKGRLPVLHGYVATSAKPNSQQLIVTANREPLLSTWNYGLGRAVAFTSDAGEWIRDWLAWPYFSSLWHQVLSWAGQPIPLAKELTPHFELLGDTGRLWVDAVDENGLFKNGLNLQARVIYPDLSAQRVSLTQAKPGLYQAHIPIRQKGNYLMKALQMEAGQAVGSASVGFVVPYLPEAMDNRIDHSFLSRIASITRGRVLKPGDNPFARSNDNEHEHIRLDSACLLIALILFLLDILNRKFYYFRRNKE